MKILGFTFALLSASAFAHTVDMPPHLDLEMTSAEYRLYMIKFPKDLKALNLEDPAIGRTIKLGQRLSTWIAKINAERPPELAIRLTSAATRSGIPIDKPNTYSPSIINTKTNDALAQMPEEMRNILTTEVELPTTIPLDDASFIKVARLLDRQYQSAARFRSLDKWRDFYEARSKQDVRGYYYLSTNKITATELENTASLPAEKLPAIKDALAKVCFNNKGMTVKSCQKELDAAFKNETVANFYRKFINQSAKIWKDFFVIPNGASRRDLEWDGLTATVPFNTPTIAKFQPYLQVNIEDEYRWEGWGLKLNFGAFSDGPRLIFQTGVVPHVNGLGGNEIVMDSVQPIEEYESQWTIRHEFGHVLGLPDCYHEFYDANLEAYVNYQLDITDLMCSRAGNMNKRIYNELKQAYEK